MISSCNFGGSAFNRSAAQYVILALAFALVATVSLADPVVKPSVPVGIDPGGVLIALIGEGIDYTNPDITKHLARDGEGELIGWDFIDGDRRPYQGLTDGHEPAGTRSALVLLRDNPAARLAVFRLVSAMLISTTDHSSLPPTAGSAIEFAAKTGAKIIVLALAGREGNLQLSTAASQRYADTLFILANQGAENAELAQLANVLSIRNANENCGSNLRMTVVQTASPDLMIPSECGDFEYAKFSSDETSVTRVAALAGRIVAAEPALTGAALKHRIIALAKPFPQAAGLGSRYGWIEEPAAVVIGGK